MQGYEAVLTTGSDEHGVNVERAAQRAGKTPQEFCDAIAGEFERQWQLLGLQIDHFQRTTSPQHARVVQDLFERCRKNGYVYKGFLHRPVLHLRQPLRQRSQARRSLSRLRPPHRDHHRREFLLQALGLPG
jgi:hypothetical protein